MLDWWNSLSLVSRVFACIAVPATAVMLLQTILLLFGMGGGGDLDGDVDGDLDVDFDADLDTDFDGGLDGELDFDPDAAGEADAGAGESGDGLMLLSIRGIVAFFSIGGWVGFVADRAGLPVVESAVLAAVAGCAALFGLAWLMKNVRKLQDSGNLDMRQALGKVGEVYLPIPPKGEGKGKITLTLDSGLLELEAVNTVRDPIPTGAPVMVCAFSDASTVVVEPFGEPGNQSRRLP